MQQWPEEGRQGCELVRRSCSKDGSTRRGVGVDYCSLHLPSHSYPPSLARMPTTHAKQNNLSAASKEAQPHKTIPPQLQGVWHLE